MLDFRRVGRGNEEQEFAFEKNDCTVLALAIASGMPYSAAHTELKTFGRKDGECANFREFMSARPAGRVYNYQTEFKYFDAAPPYPNTVAQFLKTYPKGRYIVLVEYHVFAVIDGVVYDRFHYRPGKCLKRVQGFWEFKAV